MVNSKIRLIIFFSAKDGEALYSQQKQDREMTDSNHELLMAKFRIKRKKVGKTTRPFRYGLNQIPYDLTNLRSDKQIQGIRSDRQSAWRIKTIPKKKKCKKAKWLSDEALQIAETRREAKGKGEKERYTHLNADFQRIARKDKKAFLSDQCKETEENNRTGKTRD